MKSRRSSIEMLRSLPAVFDLRDVETILGFQRKYAIQYCWRWAESELTKSAGPRTGVFYNLVSDTKATHREKEAVDKVLRRPFVVVGASALHQHGWTTQRPHKTELAVAVSRELPGFPSIDGVNAVPRSRQWFAEVMREAEPGVDGYMVASPFHALADAIAEGRRFAALPSARQAVLRKAGKVIWSPDPDDIDPDLDDDPEGVATRLLQTAKALGIDESIVDEYISDIDALSGYSFPRN